MTHGLASTKPLALVTGASCGFGRAIAQRLVADGLAVLALARRQEALDTLAAELGDALHTLVLDVTDAEAVAALPQHPLLAQGVDVLVNNAGLALGLEPAHQASLDDWQRMVDTNITGLMRVTHALLPGMVQRQRGLIINMGSIAGNYAYPGANVYGASKAFVGQFSLNLRADLAGTGVRVCCLEPGLSGGTEFSLVRFHGDQARADAVYADVQPLTPADIAHAVSWVAALPPHVNVNRMELMPTAQSFAALHVAR